MATLVLLSVIETATIVSRPQEAPPPPPSAPAAKVEDLAFLAGSWRGTMGDSEWECFYTSPEGGEVLSTSKEFKSGKLQMIEFERFRMSKGAIVLTVYPFGSKKPDFGLKSLDAAAKKAVFEDPKNDFPRRLTYHLVEPDRLVITLEGEMGGKAVSMPIDLKRMKLELKPGG
jgi:hypothetical protein